MLDFTAREILTSMGKAGRRLDEMHAVEAGAGNLSFAIRGESDTSEFYDREEPQTTLPWTVPHLAGYTVFVTGSGCRLRDVCEAPRQTTQAFVVDKGGETATWRYSSERSFTKPTSEFNSHLAVHDDQIGRRGVDHHCLIHAQPPHLVQLSHIPEHADSLAFNRAILRWEPETLVQIPDGVEFLPFMVPGSQTLMENNVRGLTDHVITIWAKHGIMVRSDVSPLAAVDKVEYAETGAMYELANLQSDGRGEGLTDEEIRAVIKAFSVTTALY